MADNNELSTKMQIIKHAINLYKGHGYANVTVQDICNAVGITRSAFYYHFKSKDDIFDDFFLYSNTYAMENLAPIFSSENYLEQFYYLFNLYLKYILEAGPEVFGQILKHNIDKDNHTLHPQGIAMRNIYEILLKKAQESGQILNLSPPSQLIDTAVYASDGISIIWCNSKGNLDLIGENRRILDTLFIAKTNSYDT
ncbi:TetR/AcrR family transcriptional regulator [Irregularibacter muris]|uniref:TetR/AcrR family transcriptional regulator n=1 Tax=Irregularibacter muris TaxID=1796619 RepID=A0AAE3HHA3_9FIRM|nr:TetR/AcrR family transcriptional regulator [Irregularibacter muris]MCR1900176.1 TetR/AcrR family transcriptional regulator [Irregularibacter muris]